MKQSHAGKRPRKVAAALGAVLLTAGCASVPTANAPTPERSSRYDGGVDQLLLYCGKLRDNGELTTAASICERAHKLNPADPRPLFKLGEILTELERLPQAAEVYQVLLEQTPSNTEARYLLGKTYIAMGRHDAALSELGLALTQSPNDARLYNAMGIAHGMLGNQDAAKAAFETGLKAAPGDVPLRNNMGLSLVLSGHHAEGIAVLEAVVADPAATATSYRNLQLAQGMAQGANGATAVAAVPGSAQIASSAGDSGFVAEPMPVMSADQPQTQARIETAPLPTHVAPPAGASEPVMLTEAMNSNDGQAQIAAAEPPADTDDYGASDDAGDTANSDDAEADTADAGTTDSAEPDTAEAGDPANQTEAADWAESNIDQPNAALSPDSMPLPGLVVATDLPGGQGPVAGGALSPVFEAPVSKAPAIKDPVSKDRVIKADVDPAAPPVPAPSQTQVATLVDGGGYSVQLASFRDPDRAVAGWRQIRASALDLLKDVEPVIRRSDLGRERGIFFRLRTKSSSKSAATQLCEALRGRDISCLTIKEAPGSGEEVPMPAAAKS